MPNRMLRDWTDSLRFENLSAEGERLFVRLLMKADDYGRFHADPRLVKAACFPLLEIAGAEIQKWLNELCAQQLVMCYEADGKKCLAIWNFGQRLKESKPKFQPPPGKESNFLLVRDDFRELPGTSGKDKELPASRARSSPSPNTSSDSGEEMQEEGELAETIFRSYPRAGNAMEVLPIIRESMRTNDPKAILEHVQECAEAMRKAPGGKSNSKFANSLRFFQEEQWRFPEDFRQRSTDLGKEANGKKAEHKGFTSL